MTESEKTMLSALRAIIARVDGVFDDPDLMAVGPLLPDSDEDVVYIAKKAIKQATDG